MKILLIVDDSEDSSRAMTAVRQGALPPGTKVFVLAVLPRHRLPPPPPPMLMALRADWRGRRDDAGHARILVGLVVEALKTDGLVAEGKVRFGDSCAEILQEARERSADLIVIGSSKSSLLRRLLVGGDLASSLAARAPCSVEVIREREETGLARVNARAGSTAARHARGQDRSRSAGFELQQEPEGVGQSRH
jgi:nucleotide-binding universal stress UspA family protein